MRNPPAGRLIAGTLLFIAGIVLASTTGVEWLRAVSLLGSALLGSATYVIYRDRQLTRGGD